MESFRTPERPNVVWAGLEGAQTLAALAADLETGLERHGFARENRPFVPHLTLARVKAKPPESLRDLLSRHAKTQFGTATIDRVELIRSELGPEGSRYTVLAAASLGDGTPFLIQSPLLEHFFEFFGVIWGVKKGNLKSPKNSKTAALFRPRPDIKD